MTNLVDAITSPMRFALRLFGRTVEYQPQAGGTTQIVAFLRGVRSDDLFAGAIQQDVAAVVDALQLQVAIGRPPQRFDRLRTAQRTFAVEEWRGAPNDDQPVFFKLLLRGGTQ